MISRQLNSFGISELYLQILCVRFPHNSAAYNFSKYWFQSLSSESNVLFYTFYILQLFTVCHVGLDFKMPYFVNPFLEHSLPFVLGSQYIWLACISVGQKTL